VHRRRTDRRGRPRKPDARRRRTTLAGRRPPSDPGTDELRRRKRAATGREDLEVNGAAVLYGHDLLDRAQYDTLGTVTELLQRVGHAWGHRDGNLNGLWEAINGALTGTSFAPARGGVGDGGYSLADGARRRLQRMCRRLDGSRTLVIELAEGKVPEIVVHVIERRVTVADTAALERLRQSLDDIGGDRRNRSGPPR
jgi:hypothetical protein